MAREMNKKVRPFRLENSDAIEENERILEAGSQKRQENRENKEEKVEQSATASTESTTSDATTASTTSNTSTPAPATQEPEQIDTPASRFDLQQGKKAANGIVVNVPMDDYMQLTMMKFHTGRTLKDLALQAIHEFVERNK